MIIHLAEGPLHPLFGTFLGPLMSRRKPRREEFTWVSAGVRTPMGRDR
jgi:hypothetical protein